MGVRFQCPSCKVIRSANDRLLGKEIKCPECGGPVQLPTAEQIETLRQAQRAAKQKAAEADSLNRFLAKAAQAPVMAEAVAPRESPEERMRREEQELAGATANFQRPKSGSGEDMDMTPMVDVTFLLLIFFMITASFSVQKSIQRPAQREDDPSLNTVQQDPEDPADVVTVQVDEFNAYNVLTADWDRTVASKQDLIVALNDAYGGGAPGQTPAKLIVEAHEDCMHSSVIAALDAGREAKFESFEVSTVEQFD